VNVVNRHETKAIVTDIVFQSGNYSGTAKASEINGGTVDSGNTAIKEDVKIVTRDINFKGNTIRYSFPAHSLTQIQLAVK